MLVLSGTGIICDGETRYTYRAGDSFFGPAATGSFSISGEIESLLTTVPEVVAPALSA